MRLLLCLLPLAALLSAGTCGPTMPPPVDDTPCTQAMCGAVPSVPPRMCLGGDGFWFVEEVSGCGRDEDTGVCAWQVVRCADVDAAAPVACTLPNSCPDGSACLNGFCHARETCNDGQEMCPTGSLCCLATDACVAADRYDLCPLPPRVLPAN